VWVTVSVCIGMKISWCYGGMGGGEGGRDSSLVKTLGISVLLLVCDRAEGAAKI